MPQEIIGTYESWLTVEFMRALAVHGGITLHQKALYGDNAHHITEGLFKSLGAGHEAGASDRGQGRYTSTKGVL
jgi:imidazoleglycerol-phosphate dehydratase